MLNLPNHEYGTIAEFQAAKARRKDKLVAAGAIALIVVGFALIVGSAAYAKYQRAAASNTITVKCKSEACAGETTGWRYTMWKSSAYQPSSVSVIMPDRTTAGDHEPTEVPFSVWVRQLAPALIAWETALGHDIRRPELLSDGKEACSMTAVACAGRLQYKIHVALSSTQYDIRNVLMHEIGHLLGVPHITGDALMSESRDENEKPLVAPTPAAIALAKLAEQNPFYLNPILGR